MPRFIRLFSFSAFAVWWLIGSPRVSAQTSPARVGKFEPMPTSRINGRGEDAMGVFEKSNRREAEQAQQVLQFSKGREHAQLPPGFQWDVPPTAIHAPYPVYPFELLRTQVAGKVQAFFVVGPDGRVIIQRIDVMGAPEFGFAVRAMLDICQFSPARKKDGSVASASVGVEYDFEPRGRSDAPVPAEGRLILRDLEKKPESIPGLAELDQPLQPVSRMPPAYPTAFQSEKPAGEAEVEFFVDTNGRVQLPHIKTASAPEFGYAAVQAVAAWRFEAARKGGRAMVVRASVPIGFEGRNALVEKP